MKKFKYIYLLFIVFLTSCSAVSVIYRSLYIASIGFDYKDNEYVGYFLLPSSMDVGANNETDNGNTNISVITGNSIVDVFNKLNNSSSLSINYKHISTLILSNNMLNENNIKVLISFIIDYVDIDFNFYIFITEENIEKIYKINNPNKEGLLATIIIDPVNLDYHGYSVKPIHFLNFCRDYYNNKTIAIPLLELDNIWNDDMLLKANNVVFINQEDYLIYKDNDYIFLKSTNKIEFSLDNETIILIDYKYIKKYKEKVIIKIESGCSIEDKEKLVVIENKIYEKINNVIEKCKIIDFLNIEYKGLDYDDIEIKVNLYKIVSK